MRDILAVYATPHRVLGRGRADRVGNHAPGLAIVPGQFDAIGRGDVRGISAGDYSVWSDVLPFRSQLPKLPVLPRLSAVGRQSPAVAHGTIPDLAVQPETKCMHKIPRDRVRRGVGRGMNP